MAPVRAIPVQSPLGDQVKKPAENPSNPTTPPANAASATASAQSRKRGTVDSFAINLDLAARSALITASA